MNIANDNITFNGCNPIELTFTITGKNQIKMTGGPKSTIAKCAVNNDEIMTNAFNSITSFGQGIETGSYVLRNTKNEDVINMSQF